MEFCKYIILFFFAILCLHACSPEKKEKEIVFNQEITEVNSNSFFYLVKEIKLSSKNDACISFPFDMCVLDSFIVISSRNNKIKLFDLSGNYLKSIGNIGEGPGEYNQINSLFAVSNNKFGFYDFGNNRITVYDTDGNLIVSERIKIRDLFNFRNILADDNNIFLHTPFTTQNPFHLIVLDYSFSIKKKYLRASEKFEKYTYRYLFNGGIQFDSKKKSIYEINSFHNNYVNKVDLASGSIVKYKLNTKNIIIPIPPLKEDVNYEEIKSMFQKGYDISKMYLIDDRFIFIMYIIYRNNVGRVEAYAYDLYLKKTYYLKDAFNPSFCDGEYLYNFCFFADEKDPYKPIKQSILIFGINEKYNSEI